MFFGDDFDWDEVICNLNFKINNFFEVIIRFQCEDFEKLCDLLKLFPQSVAVHFQLERNCIFWTERGYDAEEDAIFTLRISVHPALISSKYHFCNQIKQYLDKMITCLGGRDGSSATRSVPMA